jgi:hypothetical protein
MNNIIDITDLTDLTTMLQKDFVFNQESGCPLEHNPNWFLHSWEGAAVSYQCWKDYGNTIVFNRAAAGASVKNVAAVGYYGTGAVLDFDVLVAPTGTCWALYGAKLINHNNIIGVRIAGDKIEIVQRKVRTWTTLVSVAVTPLAGHWTVTITDTTIALAIDGTEVASANHTIQGRAMFGISGHRFDAGPLDLLQNYIVTSVTGQQDCTDSIGGTDGTEYNLNGALKNNCVICKE